MLLTLAVAAAVEKQQLAIMSVAADVESSSDLSPDRPNEKTFKLISLVAAIWAVIRRTMG